jgi:hypothetical protein
MPSWWPRMQRRSERATLTSMFDAEWRTTVEERIRERLSELPAGMQTGAVVIEAGSPADVVASTVACFDAHMTVIGRGELAGMSGRLPANAYALIPAIAAPGGQCVATQACSPPLCGFPQFSIVTRCERGRLGVWRPECSSESKCSNHVRGLRDPAGYPGRECLSGGNVETTVRYLGNRKFGAAARRHRLIGDQPVREPGIGRGYDSA